jgi:hypothetical protein
VIETIFKNRIITFDEIHSLEKPEQKKPGLSRKLQIPNERVSFGHILNAFGEEHTTTFLILKNWGKFFGL